MIGENSLKNHITKDQFLLEFFGPLGREFGDPVQWFTDNPAEIFTHIEKCKREKKPAFISVQPRSRHKVVAGFEKLFYDFDFGSKNDKFTERQIKIHKKKLKRELKIFLNHLRKKHLVPLIVKTNRGYHIYIYFDQIYGIDKNVGFWREVYKALYERLLKGNRHKYKYADSTSKEDIFRLCRIPTSIHQKSGDECSVLDTNLKPTKLRSIEYYKRSGLRRDDLKRAVERVSIDREKRKVELERLEKERKENWTVEHGFTGEIRLCFKKFMEAGEAQHQTRLAMAIEAYYAGYKTVESMVEWFRWNNDWDGENPTGKCRTQVEWFFKNKVDDSGCKFKPYRCDTIRGFGWCLGEDCPIYRKQKAGGKLGKS